MKKITQILRLAALPAILLGIADNNITLKAFDHTFPTGGQPADITAALNDNDVVLLSGDDYSVTLSDGRTLAVSDYVLTDDQFALGTKDNITFRPFDNVAGRWAYLRMAGTPGSTTRLISLAMPASGTRTLHLDRVILANGSITSGAGGALNASGATGLLVIDGDVVFLNNTARANAGAVATYGNTIFTGTTVFQGNRAAFNTDTAAWANANGGGYLMGTAGAYATTFQAPVFFLDNQSGGAGAGIHMSAGNSLIFEDTAVFKNNVGGLRNTGNNHGGALNFNNQTATVSSSLTFKGDALFEDNKAIGASVGGGMQARAASASVPVYVDFMRSATFTNNTANDGGGLYAWAGATVRFFGDTTFSGNQVVTTGGGIQSAHNLVFAGTQSANGMTVKIENNIADGGSGGGIAATGEGMDFTGRLLTVSDNRAGTTGGGVNATTLRVTGSYNFDNNQAGSSGGAVQATGTVILDGSGAFTRNIAMTNGGAIFIGANLLDIRDGALFTDNAAGGAGGAIHAALGTKLSLTASTSDIVFRGNKAGATIVNTGGTLAATEGTGAASAIYFVGSGSVGIHAGEGREVRFDDPLTGAAAAVVTLSKTGDGILSFGSHASDVTLNTTVGAGVMRLTGGAVYGKSGTGSFTLNAGRLEGNGKIQTKDATLATGAGLTVLDGGALVIEATGGGVVSTGAGLKLAGTGTLSVAGAPWLSAGEITIGDIAGTAAATLALTNTLALDAGAVLRCDLYTGNQSDRVDAAGVSLPGTGTIKLGAVATGSFTLMTWTGAGLAAGDLASLAVRDANGGELNARNNASLLLAGNGLVLNNVTSSLDMEWTGATGTLTWQSSPDESANWTDNAATNPELYFRNGDSARFGPAATGSVTVVPAGVTASGIEVAVTAGTLTFAGGAIVADAASAEAGSPLSGATGKLIKTGAG
ncbi:MAG: hypothetical protein LBC18_02355, partial [Opitutaceae bacterium]|nr:hypothetical protein [Opitutaceae bacterium]